MLVFVASHLAVFEVSGAIPPQFRRVAAKGPSLLVCSELDEVAATEHWWGDPLVVCVALVETRPV